MSDSVSTEAGMQPQHRGQGEAISLAGKLSLFTDHWAPRIVAEYNGNQIKLVKFQGEFVWHSHPDTDDFFLVVSGAMQVEFRDRTVDVGAGELLIVPRGVEHRTRSSEECHMILIEPRGTVNTGDAGGERTAASGVWV